MTAHVSNYAKRMMRLSARIFGDVLRPTDQKSMRVVQMFSEKPLEQRKDITHYYPRHHELATLMWNLRQLGLYR